MLLLTGFSTSLSAALVLEWAVNEVFFPIGCALIVYVTAEQLADRGSRSEAVR